MDGPARKRVVPGCSCGFVLLVIIQSYSLVGCYNVEPRMPVVKNGPNNSYFGLSVAQHQSSASIGDISDSMFLIGAPIYQTTQPGVVRPGGAFKCPFTTLLDDCQYLDLDRSGNRLNSDDLEEEDKSHQWLGVSVSSQGPGGKGVACGHRYVKQEYGTGVEQTKLLDRLGLGVCFTMDPQLDLEVDAFSGGIWRVCEGRQAFLGDQTVYAYCQSGTDATFAGDMLDLIIGLPGTYVNQGVLVVTEVSNRPALDVDQYVYRGGNLESSVALIQSNIGFSVTSGKFTGTDEFYFASGAPRYNSTGAVFIFKKSSPTEQSVDYQTKIVGDTLASSFGYDVAATDLNSDGFDDLIVGSPLFYTKKIWGKVSLYINDGEGNFESPPVILSSREKDGHFGLVVESINDINLDGFKDFAVGAPQENDGEGALYIYHGRIDLTDPSYTYSQKITPQQLPNKFLPISKFAYSISGGLDLDYNSYPDILVGAYESDKVILLRSKPIVAIMATLTNNGDPLDFNGVKNCQYNNKDTLCFDLEACFEFEPSDPIFSKDKLKINFEIEGDISRKGILGSRIVFRDQGDVIKRSPKINKKGEERKCFPYEVIVKPETTDILNPIDFLMTFNIPEENATVVNEGDNLPNLEPYVVLNQNISQNVSHRVTFQNECSDNVCNSDLKLVAEFEDSDVFPLGSEEEKILRITLENMGSDGAYEVALTLTFPQNVTYINIVEQQRYQCILEPDAFNLVKCLDLANPLRPNVRIEIGVRFDISAVPQEQRELNITVMANTISLEDNVENNAVLVKAKIDVSTDLYLNAGEETVLYAGTVRGQSAMENENQIGSPVRQTYEVLNDGRATVSNARVTISWPYEVGASGKWLLYMTRVPTVTNTQSEPWGSCLVDDDQVNPLGVRLNTDAGTDSPPYENAGRRRRRRQADQTEGGDTAPAFTPNAKIPVLQCEDNSANCFTFTCDLKELEYRSSVIITIFARLWNSTFIEDFSDVNAISSVKIYSNAMVELLEDDISETDLNNNKAKALTEARPELPPSITKSIPIWIIIVSVLAGLLLLVILVIILWKCGFFKRKRVGRNLWSGSAKKKSSRSSATEYSSVPTKETTPNPKHP